MPRQSALDRRAGWIGGVRGVKDERVGDDHREQGIHAESEQQLRLARCWTESPNSIDVSRYIGFSLQNLPPPTLYRQSPERTKAAQ